MSSFIILSCCYTISSKIINITRVGGDRYYYESRSLGDRLSVKGFAGGDRYNCDS
ncbi:hypothetical protein [Pseudanabaena sp. UWO311]|uniref:hypothetical protein n=1 Tax=Pseudanabaena sp. UWO311 TaxID=2487337 RepID=UPI0016815524|nr:hypothetical protein [Pseudanabaena sp. UWO311]